MPGLPGAPVEPQMLRRSSIFFLPTALTHFSVFCVVGRWKTNSGLFFFFSPNEAEEPREVILGRARVSEKAGGICNMGRQGDWETGAHGLRSRGEVRGV